jgi:hypothetical protein
VVVVVLVVVLVVGVRNVIALARLCLYQRYLACSQELEINFHDNLEQLESTLSGRTSAILAMKR